MYCPEGHQDIYIRAGRYIEYTRCIAACSLWDVENYYIVNIRVYIQFTRSLFLVAARWTTGFSHSLISPHREIKQAHLVTYITFCCACNVICPAACSSSSSDLRSREQQVIWTSGGGRFNSQRNNSGSIIWRWFGYKREDVEQQTVICKVCHKSVTTKAGSTAKLYHHVCLKLCKSTSPTSDILKKVPNQPALTQLSLASSFSRTAIRLK